MEKVKDLLKRSFELWVKKRWPENDRSEDLRALLKRALEA